MGAVTAGTPTLGSNADRTKVGITARILFELARENPLIRVFVKMKLSKNVKKAESSTENSAIPNSGRRSSTEE